MAKIPTLLALCVALALAKASCAAAQDENLTVHLVFSNHLDIGFDGIEPEIGYDNVVINRYFREYYPRAIEMANWMRAHGDGDKFIYTTHSYLVSLYLDCPPGMDLECPDEASKQEFVEAVKRGDITWHGFPHNAQYEVCDPTFLQFGIDMTHDLDRRFGLPLKQTISQRDVPGFTRAVIPIFAQKGIKAVTVGVNAGSAPPGVPHYTPFKWVDSETNASIIAFWHPGGYGGWDDVIEMDSRRDCIKLDGFSHVLCVAWRGDNKGPPPTIMEIQMNYKRLRADFPGASVKASKLDDYTEELLKALPGLELQEFTAEVGDSWIWGIQSDPLKISDFRAVQRYRTACVQDRACHIQDPSFANFSRLLMKVPEHTWGLDVKTHLADFVNYSNAPFHACLKAGCANYERLLRSWRRQAAYIPWALQALGNNHRVAKMARADMGSRRLAAQHSDRLLEAAQKLPVGPGQKYKFSTGSWEFEIDGETGLFTKLQHNWPGDGQGTDWATGQSAFGQLLYDLYNEESYDVIWNEYAYQTPISWWFYQDFGKFNLTAATGHSKRLQAAAQLVAAYNHSSEQHGLNVHLKFGFDGWLVKEAGAPAAAWIVLRCPPHTDALLVYVIWQKKTATRLPEAMWYKLAPGAAAVDSSSWRMTKLGSQVSPLEVAANGSFSQHAVQDAGVNGMSSNGWERLHVRSLDVALVSPGEPTAFPNVRHEPDLSKGVSYNLVNNVWGTNYVMWVPRSEDDVSMTFRFAIEVEDVKQPSRARRAMKPQHFFAPLTAGLDVMPETQ